MKHSGINKQSFFLILNFEKFQFDILSHGNEFTCHVDFYLEAVCFLFYKIKSFVVFDGKNSIRWGDNSTR